MGMPLQLLNPIMDWRKVTDCHRSFLYWSWRALASTIRANAQIQGYTVNNIHKKLSLLADDMLLSLKAKQTTIDAVFQTLLEFTKISNLAINEQKSAVFPLGPKVQWSERVNIEPFRWSSDTSFTYLGISGTIT